MSGQSSFLDALLPPGFGRNARLEAIDRLIDWSRLEALVTEVRSGEMGRPPYAPLSMLKALLLQQCTAFPILALKKRFWIEFRSVGFAALPWMPQLRTRRHCAAFATP